MNNFSDNQLEEMLKIRGLRVSSHRLYVLKFLMENRIHPSADDIKRALDERGYNISLSSVYNILKTFVAKGIVKELLIENGTIRYDINTHPHAHFKCLKCGNVYDIEVDIIPILESIASQEGHNATTGEVVIYGICRNCQDEA